MRKRKSKELIGHRNESKAHIPGCWILLVIPWCQHVGTISTFLTAYKLAIFNPIAIFSMTCLLWNTRHNVITLWFTLFIYLLCKIFCWDARGLHLQLEGLDSPMRDLGSWTRDWTHVLRVARQTLNCWTTGKSL